jgi:predicted Zn-dependent protease with MMP-like domain
VLSSDIKEASFVAQTLTSHHVCNRGGFFCLRNHELFRLGIFHGVPATKRSVFNLPTGPDQIVLYQKNIEAVCSSGAEVRHQIRQTLIHERGHYFGMTEEQLKDV